MCGRRSKDVPWNSRWRPPATIFSYFANARGEMGTQGRIALLGWVLFGCAAALRFPIGLVGFQVPKQVPFIVQIPVAAGPQFLDGVGVAPVIEFHAVDGAKGASAMNPAETVNEDRVVVLVLHDFHEAMDPFGSRG